VAKTTKARRAELADRIARDIQSGMFAPGMWLKQIELEKRYRATRLEVRAALDRLAQRRLVRHIANRGYHVFQADGREAAEILAIRCMLETGAADGIVARATQLGIAELRALAQRFEDLLLHGTLIDLYEANLAFHQAMLELSGNRELVHLVGDLRSRTSSAPASQWRTRARIEQSAREHNNMVSAIANRDVARLRAIIEAHILQAEQGEIRAGERRTSRSQALNA
jgi:DNA-binding GntR family transcriptional regulator